MLTVLDHAWHLAHSYRLHALPARFDYFQIGPRYWDDELRPRPANFGGFVPQSVDVGAYDLILSHLDNWCDRSQLRATPFRVLNLIAKQAPDVERLTIMHGTPCNERNRERVVHILNNAPGGPPFLVVNSEQAFDEWDLGPTRSRAIIHGYDVDEFGSSNERHLWAFTICSAGDMSRIYHGVPLLERIRRDVPVVWIGHHGDLDYFKSYQEYLDFLATSLIYVHTGQRSPMPGARTEAMLSGCCIVTTSNNDADKYIVHGETGFLCDTAEAMIETIRMLLANPRLAYQIGKQGREAARQFFHRDRFVMDWLTLLADLGVTL